MIFRRSVPPRRYRDYTRYRKRLRADFRYRCAYCLTQEHHFGGEANFNIDHHHPRRGHYARPDLENVYTNLYWTCRECNENKADHWTSPEDEAQGFRWIDPCEDWGDHDLHWKITSEGTIHWLTPIGEYTIIMLRLHRRAWLKRHWQQLYEWQQAHDELLQLLARKELPEDLAERIRTQLRFLREQLEPPILDRSRASE